MQNNVETEYPKIKKKAGGVKMRFGVSEPIRKTLYDIFMENLKTLNRATYIHRIIYAGKHKSPTQLPVMFKTTISAVNDEYCRERITGFLLIYSTFFIHLVEGSEDAISKHLSILLESPDHSECVGEMKILIQMSSVLKRLCPEWMICHGTPAKLLTPLDENESVANTAQILYTCLRRTYESIKIFNRRNYDLHDVRKSPVSLEPRCDKKIRNTSLSPRDGSTPSTSSHDEDEYRQHLPAMELIEALVESPYTQKLENYYELLLDVSQREISEDMVWPISCDLIPYDIFSTTFDTATELPRHGQGSTEKSHEEFSKEVVEFFEEHNEKHKL